MLLLQIDLLSKIFFIYWELMIHSVLLINSGAWCVYFYISILVSQIWRWWVGAANTNHWRRFRAQWAKPTVARNFAGVFTSTTAEARAAEVMAMKYSNFEESWEKKWYLERPEDCFVRNVTTSPGCWWLCQSSRCRRGDLFPLGVF